MMRPNSLNILFHLPSDRTPLSEIISFLCPAIHHVYHYDFFLYIIIIVLDHHVDCDIIHGSIQQQFTKGLGWTLWVTHRTVFPGFLLHGIIFFYLYTTIAGCNETKCWVSGAKHQGQISLL
jgi:hypothetical protein